MKNLTKILSLVLLFGLLFTNQSFSKDKEFSGIIIYNISYPNSDFDAQTQSMMPKTVKMKINGQKSRVETNMGMGSTVVIFDAAKKEGATLMDMMGQKFAIKITTDDLEKQDSEVPEYEVLETGETKEIAGYNCKKVIVKVKEDESDEKVAFDVYFTEELGPGYENYSNPIFKDIKGVMLEYSMSSNDINMLFSAVSVEKKKISDDEFVIPEGYQIMTQEELENMFGGY